MKQKLEKGAVKREKGCEKRGSERRRASSSLVQALHSSSLYGATGSLDKFTANISLITLSIREEDGGVRGKPGCPINKIY